MCKWKVNLVREANLKELRGEKERGGAVISRPNNAEEGRGLEKIPLAPLNALILLDTTANH